MTVKNVPQKRCFSAFEIGNGMTWTRKIGDKAGLARSGFDDVGYRTEWQAVGRSARPLPGPPASAMPLGRFPSG